LKSAIGVFLEIGTTYRDMVVLMYRETKSLPKKFMKATLERENLMVRNVEQILQKGIKKGVFKSVDTVFTANLIYYLLAFEPLRGWNLREHYRAGNDVSQRLTEFIMQRLLIRSSKGKR
jgi:hypothetical protein